MIISIPPPPVTPARPTEEIYWYRDGTTTYSMNNINLIMDTSKQLKYTTSTIITGRFFLVQMTLLELKYLMSSKQQARNASKNVEAKNKRHNALFSLSRFPTNSRF